MTSLDISWFNLRHNTYCTVCGTNLFSNMLNIINSVSTNLRLYKMENKSKTSISSAANRVENIINDNIKILIKTRIGHHIITNNIKQSDLNSLTNT